MKKFKDNNGKILSNKKVEEIALGNIMASMGLKELAISYLNKQTRTEILQWATDENGNFPENS